jgi:hypothetical protein
MSTARQVRANRKNARSSTGPRTPGGKARASRNAHRHGLSIPVSCDPQQSQQVEDLALRMVGATADPDLVHMARRFAEAQIDLDRIRDVRCRLTLEVLDAVKTPDREALRDGIVQLEKLHRYERRASSRRRSAVRALDAAFVAAARAQESDGAATRDSVHGLMTQGVEPGR